MNKRLILIFILLAIVLFACICPASSYLPKKTQVFTPTTAPVETLQTKTSQPEFGKLVFCESFDQNTGEPVNPSTTFPPGTLKVQMVFTYQGMTDGQEWSLLMSNGERKMSGNEKAKWEDGEAGWTAYELSEDLSDNPLTGTYTIKLEVDGQELQQGSFEVAVPNIQRSTFPAFGPVTFAHAIADDNSPIQPSTTFEPGTEAVYGVFPFISMNPNITFKREWLKDGELSAESEYVWDEAAEGISYARLHAAGGLDPGNYTLNLYIDGQVARSAKFEVLAPPKPESTPAPTEVPDLPSKPEEIIDSQLMPAWEMLRDFQDDRVTWLADYILKDHIKIFIDPEYTGLASFSYTCTDVPPVHAGDVGEIKVSQKFYNETSWVELTGALVHETTHAIQRTQGMPCGCTIEKEYSAYSAQGGFWVIAGRSDLITAYVGNDIWDDAGHFDKNKFWQAVKKIYSNCPDY